MACVLASVMISVSLIGLMICRCRVSRIVTDLAGDRSVTNRSVTNRYIVEGALRDMHAGRRVLVVAPSRVEVRVAFDAMANHELCGSATVSRGNGREGITTNEGWIRFALSGDLRGRSADVVVLGVDTWSAVDNALMLVATSPTGEVIRL